MSVKTFTIDEPDTLREHFANLRRIGTATVVAAIIIALIQLRLYSVAGEIHLGMMIFDALCVIGASFVFMHNVATTARWFEAAVAWKRAAQIAETALNAKIIEAEELREALHRDAA